MESWAIETSPKLYAEPPRFGPYFQEYFNEQKDHMPVQNLRKPFVTVEDMAINFRYQDQALSHIRDKMRTTWNRQNQTFRDTMDDTHTDFNSDNI